MKDKAQVFQKVVNKLVLLGEFPSDKIADNFKTYAQGVTGELLILSPIGEEVNSELIYEG